MDPGEGNVLYPCGKQLQKYSCGGSGDIGAGYGDCPVENLFSDTEQVQEISGREAVCLTYPREEEEKAYARVIVLDGSKITAETVEYREKAGTFPKGETAGS